MIKWEYCHVINRGSFTSGHMNMLNDYGLLGWELCSILSYNSSGEFAQIVFVFKRPLQ